MGNSLRSEGAADYHYNDSDNNQDRLRYGCHGDRRICLFFRRGQRLPLLEEATG
jgi:hypothetical protein